MQQCCWNPSHHFVPWEVGGTMPMGVGDVWWACEWVDGSKSSIGLGVNRKKTKHIPNMSWRWPQNDVAMWGACKHFLVIQVDMQWSCISRMCTEPRKTRRDSTEKTIPKARAYRWLQNPWQNDRGVSSIFANCSFGKPQILTALQSLIRKIGVVYQVRIWCFLRVTCY